MGEVEIGSKMSRWVKYGIAASAVIGIGLIVGLSVGFCGMDSYCGSASDEITTASSYFTTASPTAVTPEIHPPNYSQMLSRGG